VPRDLTAVVGSVELRSGLLGWEAGVSLAPTYRGQGIGRRALALVAGFAHDHLGIERVHAATERGNLACHGALAAAGYEQSRGPAAISLPDGRRIVVTWWQHHRPLPTGSLWCPGPTLAVRDSA
jgi:GNAT superfamily N-acetyltransferase